MTLNVCEMKMYAHVVVVTVKTVMHACYIRACIPSVAAPTSDHYIIYTWLLAISFSMDGTFNDMAPTRTLGIYQRTARERTTNTTLNAVSHDVSYYQGSVAGVSALFPLYPSAFIMTDRAFVLDEEVKVDIADIKNALREYRRNLSMLLYFVLFGI